MKIDWNEKELDRALRLYSAHSKRDRSDIVDQKAYDLSLRSVQFTEKADPKEIRAIQQEEWWPKLVAKRLGKGYTMKEFKAKAKKIIAGRVRSRSFIASAWLPAARRLAAKLGRTMRGGAKQYGRDKGFALPSTVSGSTQTAIIANTAQGAGVAGLKGFRAAVTFVTNDMLTYAYRKMQATARQYSAK